MLACGSGDGAALEPGIGFAPSTRLIELIKSSFVASLLSWTCSCPFWMTTKVGTLEMSEKAARKPASVEPASSRRTTAFWASRFDSYMLNLSACLGRDSKELRTHPLFSHSSSHSLLVAPSSMQFISRVSLHIPTKHLDVPRTKQATSFCSWIASVIPLCKVPWWNMAVGGCAGWVGRVVIVRGVKLGDALELGWCLKLHLRTTAGN